LRRPVDYRNLGPEELGSVYESLLELHPEMNVAAGSFGLTTAHGHERKTTGSYYTPPSLVQALLDSALDPVLDEAARARDPEAAILSLKVCDPACGSGHFLIAAAHRIARRLAAVRTGDDEPAPEALRHALRDVIGRCIHGVDVNEMAVELCKVALWMEALEPGKPLSFLDHRIVCGNSLLGATPALIARGVPDEAFEAIEGDDKKVATEWRKRNRREREGQMELPMVAEPGTPYGELGAGFVQLSAMGDETVRDLHERELRHRDLLASTAYQRAKLLADAWCAAFVWRKTGDAPPPVTEDVLRRLESDPRRVPAETIAEVERLAAQYRFLHWHLAFPDVFLLPRRGEEPADTQAGWNGGFDVVLGNPPWEKIQPQEQEFFAVVRPDNGEASGARRKELIRSLARQDALLYARWIEYKREIEGHVHFSRVSGTLPLSTRGRLNTYSLFCERAWQLISSGGRVGMILQSGIATDDSNSLLLRTMISSGALISLYDFENQLGLFPAVHREQRFSLVTLRKKQRGGHSGQFAFWVRSVEELTDPERQFELTANDFERMSPNSGSVPTFHDRREAEVIKGIYRRVPVIRRENGAESPWQIRFIQLVNMTSDSHLFLVRAAQDTAAQEIVRVYEGKLTQIYDHRYATFEGTHEGTDTPREVSDTEHDNPSVSILPRYWMQREALTRFLENTGWSHEWFACFHDIANPNNERTTIFTVVPFSAVGNSIPVVVGE